MKANRVKNGTELQLVSDEFVIMLPNRDYTVVELDKHFDRLRDITKVVLNP